MDLYYPVNTFGPAMKGMVLGGLGIFHVFLAMFAIGGGMLMCYFQWLAQTGRNPYARRFVDDYFKLLVLISFVVGAVTGVAMWFVSIQVSPRTIGMMVGEFHWVWGIEWTFFSLEITAGYCFYRYSKVLTDTARFRLLLIYAVASWFSLFWINGILSWQLTPGNWPETRWMWDGFFNPSFFPSLLFRTVTAMTVGSLVACVVINAVPWLDRPAKESLIHRAAHLLAPMALMPFLGAWFLFTMPPDSRAMALGGNITMTMFMGASIGASALIGLYALVGMLRQQLYINGATASLLCMLAFVATGGGEFVREGVRKPYSIRKTLYSNSVTQADVARLRKIGCVTNDPYPMRNPEQYPNEQLLLGAKVYRFHCSVCHTVNGANGLSELCSSWSTEQKRLNIAQLQRTKAFMPPFAGNNLELEALVQYVSWENANRPADWKETDDPAVLEQIQRWLDEVGVESGIVLEEHLTQGSTH
ncbi:cytochrome BD quinol oxidase subunit I [Lignipirellula cremea]|uniref:Bacterial Cytochrome Ubiquinol Oxidase n=1 Tax=Lignipirellula cremea TaxID=2528010 RepID=A0A518DMR0_9BACT|nr:cytochrome BD quinol oxidase subunit I [Lignipirellula cremea]QDU93101.1 hypothetical protein Pla8534_08800 [Lignipirellula cremea]